MFGVSPATRVYLAVGATDLRRSFDGLYGLVQGALKADPLSGHLFVFCNRSRTRVKVLYFDGSGLWVCAKRLEEGRFSWPENAGTEASRGCDVQGLLLILGGIDPKETRRKRWWRGAAEPKQQESEVTR
jgi:transposase